MTVSQVPRPSVKPSWEWQQKPLWPCQMFPHGLPGQLVLGGVPYSVHTLSTPFDEDEPLVPYGLRLVKADGTLYDISFDAFTCDCPDCTFRQRDCKHLLACADLLAAFREGGRS